MMFDAVFITNPTHLHIQTALKLAPHAKAIFLEKPIDRSNKDLDRLMQAKIPIYVAYVLRFHPVIVRLKEMLTGKKILHVRVVSTSYLPNWRPGRKASEVYSAHADQGGGVILDLSHEFDYIEYLFGPIRSMQGDFGRVSGVTVDSEDFVDAIIQCPETPVNLYMNYFGRNWERSIVIETEDQHIKADLIHNTINDEEFPCERDDIFAAQLRYFFEHIDDPNMMNNLKDAAALFEKLLHFKECKKF